MVLPVPGGNDKSVGPGLLTHLTQPGEGRPPRPTIFRSVFQTPGVGIANSHHLYMIRIATNQVSAIHRDPPDSHSHNRHSHLAILWFSLRLSISGLQDGAC